MSEFDLSSAFVDASGPFLAILDGVPSQQTRATPCCLCATGLAYHRVHHGIVERYMALESHRICSSSPNGVWPRTSLRTQSGASDRSVLSKARFTGRRCSGSSYGMSLSSVSGWTRLTPDIRQRFPWTSHLDLDVAEMYVELLLLDVVG